MKIKIDEYTNVPGLSLDISVVKSKRRQRITHYFQGFEFRPDIKNNFSYNLFSLIKG